MAIMDIIVMYSVCVYVYIYILYKKPVQLTVYV